MPNKTLFNETGPRAISGACKPWYNQFYGGLGRSRTGDLRLRRPLLYPTELRVRTARGSLSCNIKLMQPFFMTLKIGRSNLFTRFSLYKRCKISSKFVKTFSQQFPVTKTKTEPETLFLFKTVSVTEKNSGLFIYICA